MANRIEVVADHALVTAENVLGKSTLEIEVEGHGGFNLDADLSRFITRVRQMKNWMTFVI